MNWKVLRYVLMTTIVLGGLMIATLVPRQGGDPRTGAGTGEARTPSSEDSAAEVTPATEVRELSPTTTPIKHFITLMQENHSFDNYFGTYPGADGIPLGACIPRDPEVPEAGCVEPFPIGERAIVDLGHSLKTFEEQYNNGAMDGFLKTFADQSETGDLSVGYYDDNDIPYYWTIADEYVLFDRFFTSAKGGSVPNHFYWVTGTPGNPESAALLPNGFDHVPTIFDQLEAAGVSWKFYVQNYDPTITFRNPEAGDRGSQIVWVPILNYNRFLDDPELFAKIVPFDEFFSDLENGTLPEVAYMVPSGASEHPPGSIQAGERFVRSIITALMRSSVWDSSAFMWTYDDWGGWYDHVPPPQVDEWGYGFRAPALLVSAYAKQGYIDSTELDFTSMLKFIELNWGLEPLAERDRQANSLDAAFDFTSPPRSPILLSRDRNIPEVRTPNTSIVYVAYGIGLAIPLVLYLIAGMLTWSSKLGNGDRDS